MAEILLVRHGQSTWNAEHRWQGHADPPLTPAGLDQARVLAAELHNVPLEAIYASDLHRARETAEVVARAKGLVVTAMAELREIDVGEWGGLTTDEIKTRFPEGWKRHSAGGDGWEHGEAHAEMSDRIVGAIAGIAAAHRDGRVLCVLHGGVIRALLARAAGIPLAEYRRTRRGPANGIVSRISVQGEIWSPAAE